MLMDNPNVTEAGDPGDIYGSLMYTAGIEFRLGGGTDRPAPRPEPSPGGGAVAVAPDEQPRPEEPAGLEQQSEEERLRARADSLEAALAALQANQEPQGAAPRPFMTRRADTSAVRATTPAPSPVRSGRTMVVPVPEEGEIYIRFGDGAGAVESQPSAQALQPAPSEAAPETMEERIREALRQELQGQQADTARALSEADIERLIQRTIRDVMREREDTDPQPEQTAQAQRIQRLQSQVNELQRQLREQRVSVEAEPEPVREESIPFYRQTLGRPLTYLVPITGFRVGEGENQFQIGIRGDYRSTPTSRLHLLPELSFGLGGGPISPTILVNGAYSFLRDTTTELVGVPLEPYAGLGVGIASLGGFTFEPVTNAMIGVDYRVLGDRRLFLEYSTFDLFDTHRVHFGVRVRL